MSNIYLNEPPTSGKVLLHTSLGDIDVELWSKEAPLACRNFIQLSLEGYYDGTLFHRVIKDFMAQGGDPTNTGKGGLSSWGRPFKDEIHGRIKFNHRGQLAMANENKPNTNQSQFFITLGDCEWLNRKHTIFGKVTGNTIFNVLRMSDAECGEDERPLEDIVVKAIEVLWNPFDDIIPRNVKASALASDRSEQHSVVQKKKRKGKKDLKLLSFGEDALELEGAGCVELEAKRMISAHDASCVAYDVALAKKVDPNMENLIDHSYTPLGGNVGQKRTGRRGISMASQLAAERDASLRVFPKEEGRCTDEDAVSGVSLVSSPTPDESRKLVQIKQDIIRSRRAVKVMTGEEATKHRDDASLKDFVTPLEKQRQRFIKRKREHGSREDETLSKLVQFSTALKMQKKKVNTGERTMSSKESEDPYRGQIIEEVDDGNVDDEEWHVGKLKFRKHIDDAYRAGSDGRKLHDYTVIDPQNERTKYGV